MAPGPRGPTRPGRSGDPVLGSAHSRPNSLADRWLMSARTPGSSEPVQKAALGRANLSTVLKGLARAAVPQGSRRARRQNWPYSPPPPPKSLARILAPTRPRTTNGQNTRTSSQATICTAQPRAHPYTAKLVMAGLHNANVACVACGTAFTPPQSPLVHEKDGRPDGLA